MSAGAALLTFAALLCLAAAIQPTTAAAANGSISGVVSDGPAAEGHWDCIEGYEDPMCGKNLIGNGVQGIEVCAWSTEGGAEDSGCTLTKEEGRYEIPNLDSHSYLVEFWDPEARYATQFFDRQSFSWEADPVLVGTEAVTGIDGELDRAAVMQGVVRDASNGAAVEEVKVCAWEVVTEGGRCTFTDPTGNYALRRLVPGVYKVEFSTYEPFEAQYWDHKAEWSEASEIMTSEGGKITGIDADLLGVPSPLLPQTPPIVMPPIGASSAVTVPKSKPCKKRFRKKRVNGKVRCVSARKHRQHQHRKARDRAAFPRFSR